MSTLKKDNVNTNFQEGTYIEYLEKIKSQGGGQYIEPNATIISGQANYDLNRMCINQKQIIQFLNDE